MRLGLDFPIWPADPMRIFPNGHPIRLSHQFDRWLSSRAISRSVPEDGTGRDPPSRMAGFPGPMIPPSRTARFGRDYPGAGQAGIWVRALELLGRDSGSRGTRWDPTRCPGEPPAKLVPQFEGMAVDENFCGAARRPGKSRPKPTEHCHLGPADSKPLGPQRVRDFSPRTWDPLPPGSGHMGYKGSQGLGAD